MFGQKKLLLAAIRPHLEMLIDILGQIEQAGNGELGDCTGFEEEYSKSPDEICDTEGSLYGPKGQCFRCVFAHYGIDLNAGSFTSDPDARFGDIVVRWRAILRGYLSADERLRGILLDIIRDNPCEGLNISTFDIEALPSLIDRLLGEGALQIEKIADRYPNRTDSAITTETSHIGIPDDQFVLAEKNEIEYQSIEYLVTHELGHIFHNRLQEVLGTGRDTVELQFGSDVRIVNVSNLPRVVADYLQAVGGYYNISRDFNPPAEYRDYAIALTNLNFNAPSSGAAEPLFTYDPDDPNRFSNEQRAFFDGERITIYHNDNGREFVYIDQNRQPASSEDKAARFIEEFTYIPNTAGLSHDIIVTYLPNESRDTAEPKEGFADSFAAYILAPNVLKDNPRGQFFDRSIQQWLCEMLRKSF